MQYKISISHNGKFLLRTASDTILSDKEVHRVYSIVKNAFPESEGFKITVSRWECYGKHVDMVNL